MSNNLYLNCVTSKSHTAAGAACAAVAAAPPVPSKNATTAKELRDLMYKHYCVGKGKLKKPSANAIKKGIVSQRKYLVYTLFESPEI